MSRKESFGLHSWNSGFREMFGLPFLEMGCWAKLTSGLFQKGSLYVLHGFSMNISFLFSVMHLLENFTTGKVCAVTRKATSPPTEAC